MDKLTSEQKALITALQNSDDKSIDKDIKNIEREGGSFIVAPLVSLFTDTSSEIIQNRIYTLFLELKDTNSVEIFMQCITKHTTHPNIDKLVSTCWQSSLDFSPYILSFVDFIKKGNMLAAMEAITVISENINLIEKDTYTKLMQELSNVKSKDETINLLLGDLINTIKNT